MKFYFSLLLALSAVALTTQQEIAIEPPEERPVPRPRPTRPTTTVAPLPENLFSVISPNTIRPNKDFTFYVRALDVKSAIFIKIVLASDDGSYNVEKTVRLSRSTTKSVGTFDTTSLPAAANSFTLTVSSDSYNETKSINYVKKENSVFIQTNKGIFKPSEIVQYRIFSIDSESNAYDPKKPVSIALTDPRNNEIGKVNDAKFVNGKFQGEFQLPSKPIFGTWRLSVTYNENEGPVVKTFTVQEYTLSMFTASLTVPSIVSAANSRFPITINAEYTFKQPISGIATVTISRRSAAGAWTRNISCTDTKTTFFVDIVRDLELSTASFNYLTVTLVFVDPKTNTKATDQAQVKISPNSYILEIVNERVFRVDEGLRYTVVTKTLDGKPAPRVSVKVLGNNQLIATLTTGSRGTAVGTYRTVNSVSIEASCNLCNKAFSSAFPLGSIPSASEGIKLELITANPSFKNPIEIIASVSEETSSFFYFATSKGVLVDYRRVYFDDDDDLDNDPRTVEFSITPDFSYAPFLNIYAFYYKKSEAKFIHTSLTVNFNVELPNYLRLRLRGADASGNTVVTPGSNISLTIQSKANSIVSLSAIDQRVLQLANNQNFTVNEVYASFNEYTGTFIRRGGMVRRRPFYSYDYYGASSAGLNFYTNVPIPQRGSSGPMSRPRAAKPSAPRREAASRPRASAPGSGVRGSPIKVRKDFREVFLFEDVEIETDEYDEEEGYSVIRRKVTDQITTYLIFGVSMNKNSGMGLPTTLPSATIYLPFFISAEVPSTIKRGETLTINIQVFNYLTSSQSTDLTVVKDENFDVVSASSDGWTISGTNIAQRIRVSSNQIFTAKLQIRPKAVGIVTLKITARGSSAGDAIEKILKVNPEGVERSITTSTLVAVDTNNPAANQTLSCTLPSSAFNDTAEISATVIGDILGKALNNLDKLIVMPGGCGEQTMLGLVPDIAIYKYLEATGQLTTTLKAKLVQYITGGYQNELQYQRFDGSFSAFGNSDPSGSSWLTAYVAKSFNWAKNIITISTTVVQNAINFIIEQQNADGSFNEPGRVIHSDMQGAAGNGIALTAYITIALSELAADYPSVIPARNRAVAYLEQQLSSVTDAYPLAVITYALTIANSGSATTAYNKFYALRTETATEIFWSVPAPASQNFYGARSLDVEVTAYGLIILVKRNVGLVNSLKAVKNLLSKSNSFGGYSSSQDTVMGLVALSEFASTYTLTQANVNLVLTPNFGTAVNAQVNKNNSLTLQSFSLNSRTRSLGINIRSGSTGVAIVSLTCNFYENPARTVPSFRIAVNFDNSCEFRLQLQVCATPVSGNSSNMAIMEVRLPSGYRYYEAWWLRQNQNNGLSKTETFEDNNVVIFYFDKIQAAGTCITFSASRTAIVADLKPGSVIVTDYYDTSKQGSASFSIPSSTQSASCRIIYR